MTITTARSAAAAKRELDALYDGASPYYGQLTARYGRYMPEERAEHIAQGHGTTLEELDTELYWGGVVNGAGTTVHVASLLAALGY